MRITRVFFLLIGLVVPVFTKEHIIISQEQYDQLLSLAEMAKVAYCTVNPFFTAGPFPEQCSRMKYCHDQAQVEIVRVFRPEWWSGDVSGTGFVAVDDVRKEVFAVFRGSCSPGDWVTDFTALQSSYLPVMAMREDGKTVGEALVDEFKDVDVKVSQAETVGDVQAMNDVVQKIDKEVGKFGEKGAKLCHNCKVHYGVYLSHARLFPEVLKTVKPYLDRGYTLTVTGHSLGGGYTQLAGMEFQYLGVKPRIVSFGQLKVGNPEMNEFCDRMFGTKEHVKTIGNGGEIPYGAFARVYQTSDVVPVLPPFKKYTHSGLAIAITQISLPQSKEVVQFRGKSDNWSNEEFDARWEDIRMYFILYQHINYLTRVSFPCNDAVLLEPADAWDWGSAPL